MNLIHASGDGAVEGSRFFGSQVVPLVVDDQLEHCPFRQVRGLIDDDATVLHRGSQRHGWMIAQSGRAAQSRPVDGPGTAFGRSERRRSRGIPTAREVDRLPHGSQVNYVGQVICRQRPQTASGVTFFTLEDETGFVNLVLWVRVFEAHRALARTAPLLGVRGRIEEPNASGI